MNLKSSYVVWCVAVGILSGSAARADDWPQWRGPNRDGISKEAGLLKEWPKEGPKLLWQAKTVGGGYSTPSVVGERLYLVSNEGLENESVKAFSTRDGKELWSTRIGVVGEPNQRPAYPGARSTPTVDGEWVYAFGSDGDLVCLSADSGKARWQSNVRKEFGGKYGKWAYAESPLVDGDLVVCTPGGENATMLAVRKQTGEVAWKGVIPGGDAAGYASIVIAEVGGIKQYVQFVEKGLVGVEAKTGRYDRPAQNSPANIPTPLVHENYIYAGAGRSGGGVVKLTAKDGTVEVEPLYFENKMPTGIGGSVKIGKEVYGTSQAMLCLDFLTGRIRWEDRGIGAAGICYADGRLYLHGENGEVALVEPSPEGYREKGRFTPPDRPDRGNSKSWAHPVVANGRLYVRDLGSLWCYDVRGGAVALK
jgi:outer membrane protein assembly factor BamB